MVEGVFRDFSHSHMMSLRRLVLVVVVVVVRGFAMHMHRHRITTRHATRTMLLRQFVEGGS